jgi:predicted glycoside hydrolase/deacetylase ChbG (UPF0249 family)
LIEAALAMKPLLIISADDAGIHPAIDRGILETIDHGPVHSVDIIACGDTAPDFAEELEKRPGIGVGLHLALTRAPALASTSLAMSGEPMPSNWVSLAKLLARGTVGREDVAQEIRAQINRARTIGLRVDHVSGHEHVHLLPGIADVIARTVEEEGLPRRVRITRAPRAEMARDPRAVALRAASSFSRRTAWRGFLFPERIAGIADTGAIEDLADVLDRGRSSARSIELIVHPGDRGAQGEPELPDWPFNWVGELLSLTSVDWRRKLSEDFIFGTYRDL